MAFVSLRQLLDHAAEYGYGVPAFNVNNLEQIQAIMEAAQATNSPVILQASAGARKYAGEAYLRHMVLAAVESHPDIPVVLHQDHGATPGVCMQSIRSGFTSVMMDGSLREDAKTPASYEYNVDVTRTVCEMAHAVGVSVEGELGCLGSLETGEAGEEDGVGAAGKLTHDMMLTDPVQAKDFVAKTGVDALATATGPVTQMFVVLGFFSGHPERFFVQTARIGHVNRQICPVATVVFELGGQGHRTRLRQVGQRHHAGKAKQSSKFFHNDSFGKLSGLRTPRAHRGLKVKKKASARFKCQRAPSGTRALARQGRHLAFCAGSR